MPMIRDVVLPICRVVGGKWQGLLGTGFLVSPGNLLVTARHVIEGQNDACVIVAVDGEWRFWRIQQVFQHPREDLALCEVVGVLPQGDSWIQLSRNELHSSATYDAWGYPDDVLFDYGCRDLAHRALAAPDLVFTKGYIRRRFTGEILGLRGSAFVELSDVAGSGCSGGPLVIRRENVWSVAGVYLGERVSEYNGVRRERGYALRLSDVAEELNAYRPGLVA